MHSFTAIDVETANADLGSICQVGIVRFELGVPVDEWQVLVDPHDELDPVNISIHGIDASAIAGAPGWPDLAGAVSQRLLHQTVVCHTAFDRVSIARAFSKHALEPPALTWLDSARVARRAWPEQCGRSGYGLTDVCRMLGIPLRAHVAVEDARAAGYVLLRAIEATGVTIDEWFVRVERPMFARPGGSITQDGNPDGHLAGHAIVFTGALSMPRAQAAQMAAAAGCDVQTGITRTTTLLVVGDQDIRVLGGKEKSSKHLKAEALILKGQPIRILAETDFAAILAAP
jgi:DNA polymerase-3 subunit epsilon